MELLELKDCLALPFLSEERKKWIQENWLIWDEVEKTGLLKVLTQKKKEWEAAMQENPKTIAILNKLEKDFKNSIETKDQKEADAILIKDLNSN